MKDNPYSPKALLKARRPERFSDSTIIETTSIDRLMLEYHFETLTNRNQETEFARFAFQLCKKTICPNLLPQTGPAGGGDSKVDSETFPISPDLALLWYNGWDSSAATERWAFAFSAKKEWLDKVKLDVEKIALTKRGYKKAFFVTNQFVADKKRAEVEDDLRNKYGIDVRILDRTWILDQIFTKGLEQLAIEELGITGQKSRTDKKGPHDIERTDELEEVNKRIEIASQESRFDSAVVEDMLSAADLSRGLEKPRSEVEGLYARADKLAVKFGFFRQKVEAAYQWAWTLMYWYEDYHAFSDQYKVVEERALGSQNIYDLERLTSLWISLHNTIMAGGLDKTTSLFEDRTRTLIKELERLKNEPERPSSALEAESLLLQVQLILRLFSGQPVDEVLRSFAQVVLKSSGLVGFPLDSMVEALTEVGPSLEELPGYEELFQTILKVTAERDGEITPARYLLERGESQLKQGKPVKAIATLGQALGRLYKHETRDEVIRALYLCGLAYEEIGLLWAARGTQLMAANIATHEFWQYGNITPYQASCYRRLKWLELRLGRLPQTLSWHELDMTVRSELQKRGYDPKSLFADTIPFNGNLVRLILGIRFEDLSKLDKFPDVLDALDLSMSADALLFLLGHTARMEEATRDMPEGLDAFLSQIKNMKTNVSAADTPVLYEEGRVVIQSKVVGCKLNVDCELKSSCVEVVESILAIVESFLATSSFNKVMSKEPEIFIKVDVSETIDLPVNVVVEEKDGRPYLKILCRPVDLRTITVEDQQKLREMLFESAVTVLSQFVIFSDIDKDLESLFKDERVSERAGTFAGTFKAQANLLGPVPKNRLSAWVDEQTQAYPLVRSVPWRPIDNPEEPSTKEAGSPKPKDHESAVEYFSGMGHDKMETVSLIRTTLWDKAHWSGTAFFTHLNNDYPPVLGIVFRDQKSAEDIFKSWQAELGAVDEKEQIRILIVKGIDKANPYSYRVVVGSNPEVFLGEEKVVSFISRHNQMDATSFENLDRFIRNRDAVDAFYLAPAISNAKEGTIGLGEIKLGDRKLFILVHKVYIREAWQIGRNDLDATAIKADDDPVIPDGITDPPVKELMVWLKSKE